MSRKALFANLKPASVSAAESEATVKSEDRTGDDKSVADPIRAARLRSRPILGAPELIKTAAAPVGALGQSLSEFKAQSERASAIERQLAEGQAVVDLDPTLIDPSFVKDRMPTSKEAHARLVEAIREHGQQVPILVRPHPSNMGRYQVAYGHRRLRAALELQRTVRAVVKALSDDELVIAQGQENNERQDLSFIEKARFARDLEEKGFKRDTIMTALSVYKSDLSNMLSVISRIPEDVVNAIGPALGIGRRGWIDLAERFSDPFVAESVAALILAPDFLALESDQRFRQAHAVARPSIERPRFENWTTAEGAKFAKIVQNAEKISVTIDRRVVPEFGDYILERLQSLYEEFKSRR
ncbi:plasmid partitioning protein RepB [Methylocystis sp. ATCC 49242]|uniref:plasmid partitioning protein RepB n=1 Tax=Methylocystis sp. ATCC 49242 TaxID=622637 RepID=UPI0001F880AB|nr:plasmid partitioning protein RepB [Methylocystis sp. ATCC 49242]